MPSFLDLAAETRELIYYHLFLQPTGELLGLSREPEYDYTQDPPDDWIADSREVGLVYNWNADRASPTNSRALRTCKLVRHEATLIFYGTNRIRLYAEDNNDIFYWLLDIGEQNRRTIRHLEIGWAYGVCIETGRGNIHGIVQSITDMAESEEEDVQKRRQQLIDTVHRLEDKTVRLIIRTLNILASNQDLFTLAVYLPGVDGADIWDLPNDNLYFAEEIFSNSTTKVHACIPKALAKMVGIETLTIGYTKDIELAEKIARATGAKELIIRVCPEGASLRLDNQGRAKWIEQGWRLEAATAHKTLVADEKEEERRAEAVKRRKTSMEKRRQRRKNPEYGRLTAAMFFDTPSESDKEGKDVDQKIERNEEATFEEVDQDDLVPMSD